MGAITEIKTAILAIVCAGCFASGIGLAYAFLAPRIDVWKLNYEKEVVLNSNLQSSLNEQNAEVIELGEKSESLIKETKIAVDKAKTDQSIRERRIGSLMSEKAPTNDICAKTMDKIDYEMSH